MMSRLEKVKSWTSGFSSVKKQIYQSQAWGLKKNSVGVGVEKEEMSYGDQEIEKVMGCRAESRAREAEREDRWEMECEGRWVAMRVSDERGKDERRSHERGNNGRGSEERGRDEQGNDERGSDDTERRCNMLQGIVVCCIILWVMTMYVSMPQCAASCCDELLCVAVCGGVLQVGASVTGSQAGGKRGVKRHSVLKHFAAHCNVLRQWILQPKKKNKNKKVVVACSKVAQGLKEWCQLFRCVIVCSGWSKRVETRCSVLCVGTGRTVLLGAAVCCNALKWVASKFRYINIYDNKYVNRNRCVCEDKCIWDTGDV